MLQKRKNSLPALFAEGLFCDGSLSSSAQMKDSSEVAFNPPLALSMCSVNTKLWNLLDMVLSNTLSAGKPGIPQLGIWSGKGEPTFL